MNIWHVHSQPRERSGSDTNVLHTIKHDCEVHVWPSCRNYRSFNPLRPESSKCHTLWHTVSLSLLTRSMWISKCTVGVYVQPWVHLDVPLDESKAAPPIILPICAPHVLFVCNPSTHHAKRGAPRCVVTISCVCICVVCLVLGCTEDPSFTAGSIKYFFIVM